MVEVAKSKTKYNAIIVFDRVFFFFFFENGDFTVRIKSTRERSKSTQNGGIRKCHKNSRFVILKTE